MYFHIIALLSGNRKKVTENKSEQEVINDYILPYITNNGIISTKWGASLKSYKVLELTVYKTERSWSKKSGVNFEKFIGHARNVYPTLLKKAEKYIKKTVYPVFIVMPIQGEKFGTQNEQRIYKEFDKRFELIEETLQNYNCVAVRIDKEYHLDELVKKIKEEIINSKFVIADLTEERPSCYFECGYAEAAKKPIIYVASKESVINPGTETIIHFDIHRNIQRFTNHDELKDKIKNAIEKNHDVLFKQETIDKKEIIVE